MAGNAGPTLKHPDGAEDMSLFHRQHPSTPPPRFSSPSRLQSRRTKAELAFKTAANRAATSTLLQGIVWTALSVLAILLHYGWLPVTDPKEEIAKWDSWEFIMYSLYFKENAVMPGLPHEGIVSATQMLYFAIATLAANFLMLFLSFVLMARLCGGASPRADLAAVVMWAVSVIVVTTVDVLVAAAMARDLVLFLGSWEPSWPGNVTALRRCPGAILALALRGGVLLLANVTCMLVVLRRLHEHRNKADRASQAANKADGPIDGFLYRSGDKEGVNNPVFVPDDAGQPWTTFKPEEHAAQRANGHRGHDLGYLSKDDPEDISHLMWMEEVDKHVDVHMRRGRVEDRRPQHHRYGFVEDRHLGHVIPSGRLSLRAAVGPLPPGPLPVGYPDPNTSQGLRLSRVALAEPPSHALYALSQPPSQTHFQAPSHALSRGPSQTHFQAPSHALSQAPYQTYFQAPSQAPSHALFQPLSQAPALPPVDYSPRARRRGDGGAAARAADRALAAGRANLHPVRQDRY